MPNLHLAVAIPRFPWSTPLASALDKFLSIWNKRSSQARVGAATLRGP